MAAEREQAGLIALHERFEGTVMPSPDQGDQLLVALEAEERRTSREGGQARGMMESGSFHSRQKNGSKAKVALARVAQLVEAARLKRAQCGFDPHPGHNPFIAKILFIPFSVIGGLLAGFVSKKVFEQVWGLIDEQEPPEAEHREISWGKLIASAALSGAIFRVAKEAADHGSRQGFAQLTGTWPGQERPDEE